MSLSQNIDAAAKAANNNRHGKGGEVGTSIAGIGRRPGLSTRAELGQVLETFLTTLTLFGVFLVQGVLVARILGPLGRGEFGTAIYFPRDVFLYAGLLGGIEIVNSYASRGRVRADRLKYTAARLGLVSGSITAIVAAVVSSVTLFVTGKMYLLPFCLVCCLFLPWEHMHLVICGVDRGNEAYRRYNFNRLMFALAFPVLVLICFGAGLHRLVPGEHAALWLMCILFVLSRVVGILPTLRGMNLFQFWQQGRLEPDVPSAKVLLREGRPYAISTLATELFERLDILLILALATVEMSGHYFVAVPAAALLTIAPNALAVFTFNAGADTNRRVTMRLASSVMLGAAAFQVASTVVFCWLIPGLMIFAFTDQFAESIPFVLALAPASAIRGYLQAVDGYLKGRGKPMIGVGARIVSIFAMLAFVALAYSQFEVPLLSIPAAALVGQALSMLIISIAVIRDIRRSENVLPSFRMGAGK